MASKLGTVFVELSLDDKIYKERLSEVLTSTTATAKGIETSWRALGTKSDVVFDAQRRSYENAMTLIKNSTTSTHNDIIRAEEAKNAKIHALNEQQYGKQQGFISRTLDGLKHVTHGWMDIMAASMMVSQAASLISAPFIKGFQAVEDYGKSVASLAAMVVTFSERQKGQTLEDQWKGALQYSSAMVPILENIAAKTLLSGHETTALANAFARSGVFLDATNAKQVESFTRISNALPLMTKGQEIMRQISTEIRSVMTGANEQSSMMLQTLKAVDPQIEEHLKLWRNEGTVLEHIGDLLSGFGPATALLENQWQAVKTTIDTTATQILRGLMKPAYESIIDITKDLNGWLVRNKDTIIDWGTSFRIGAISVQAEVMRLGMLLDKIGGSMTWVAMGLFAPGAALGIENSVKQFDKLAKANETYAANYAATDKELEALALKQIGLENSLLVAKKKTSDGAAKFHAKKIVDEKEEIAAAKKAANDIIAAEKSITEAIRKATYEAETIGQTKYARDVARIKSEAEKFTEAMGGKEISAKNLLLVQQYVATEMGKADKEAYEEMAKNARKATDDAISEMERQIAEGVKLSEAHIKGAEEYEKLVSEAAEFASTENERAINKIISEEKKKVADIQLLYDKGYISFEQAEALKGAYHAIATGARLEKEIENAKKIADINYTLIKDIAGYETAAHTARVAQIASQAAAYEKDLGARADTVEKNLAKIKAKYEDEVTAYQASRDALVYENGVAVAAILMAEADKLTALKVNFGTEQDDYQALQDAMANVKSDTVAAILKSETDLAESLKASRDGEDAAYQAMLEKQTKTAKDAADTQVKLSAWKKDQNEKAYIEMGKKSTEWSDGVGAALLELEKKHTTWGETAYEVTKTFTTDASKQLGDNFFKILKGNYDQVGIDWGAMWDGMLTTLSKKLADMVVEAAAHDIAMMFKASWTGDSSSILGIINKGWDLWNSVTGGSTPSATDPDMFTGVEIPKNAAGGPVAGGKPTWVGEKGPELLFPRGPGYVMEHNQSMAYAARNGGYIPGYALGGFLDYSQYDKQKIDPAWGVTVNDPFPYYRQVNPETGQGFDPDPAWVNALVPGAEIAGYDYSAGNVAQMKPIYTYESISGADLKRLMDANVAIVLRQDPQSTSPTVSWGTAYTYVPNPDGQYLSIKNISQGPSAMMALLQLGIQFAAAVGAVGGFSGAGLAGEAGTPAFTAAGGGATSTGAMVYGSEQMIAAGADLGLTAAETLSLTNTALGGVSALELYAMDVAKGYAVGQAKKWAAKQVMKLISSAFAGGGELKFSFEGAAGDLGWLTQGMGNIAPRSDRFAFPAYERGIDYVPRTGLAMVHEGERVQSKREARRERNGDGASLPPVQVNWNVDGRTLASIIYKQTKSGVKVIHQRGITNI